MHETYHLKPETTLAIAWKASIAYNALSIVVICATLQPPEATIDREIQKLLLKFS